jgi:hypothetical protein
MEVKYVVCLDSIGQDRQFTADQKRFTLQTLNNFRETWNGLEGRNLKKDRDRRVALIDADREYNEGEGKLLVEEEEKYMEDRQNAMVT